MENKIEMIDIGNDMNAESIYCCELMKKQIESVCAEHGDPFECPDNLIHYSEKLNEYGLIVHDGGSSFVKIDFCPFCGTELSQTK